MKAKKGQREPEEYLYITCSCGNEIEVSGHYKDVVCGKCYKHYHKDDEGEWSWDGKYICPSCRELSTTLYIVDNDGWKSILCDECLETARRRLREQKKDIRDKINDLLDDIKVAEHQLDKLNNVTIYKGNGKKEYEQIKQYIA